MDFTLDPTQASLRDLARQIFADETLDLELWNVLGEAGLLSVGIEDGGFIEQCVVLVEQGRTVAPVSLWSHLVAGWAAGSADGLLTLTLDDSFAPALDRATRIVYSDGGSLYVANADRVEGDRRETTHGLPEWAVRLDVIEGQPLAADVGELRQRATVALCALGVGVAERALELTASYTSQRKQFDRPLGSFQAVQQRAADAYIDVEAMRWTMWHAAWRLDQGLDAGREVAIAKFWAAEGGQRVVSSAQHLHGGLGADIDYPLYRYTLWAKWIELAFGAATPQLARLGAELAS